MTQEKNKINFPEDLRSLELDRLEKLANELRKELVATLSQTPGHFASNFGTVELSIALHKVFDTPRDKLIWDIGHQAYPHKMLTGRRSKLHSVRQHKGISGFLSRDESEYDVFGAGHSSTSIAAALGIAAARDLKGDNYKVIALIGDGGMTGGMAFEAMNAAGDFEKDFIIVLNDNQLSISATIGAFAKYFNRIITNPTYNTLRSRFKELMKLLPNDARSMIKRFEAALKPGMFFEELGFRYFGPLDGHNLEELIGTFQRVKEMKNPILVHVLTKKGKGNSLAENDPIGFYSVNSKIDLQTGKSLVATPSTPKYTDFFSRTLVELAREDERIVAITAAMPTGTGLDKFQEAFPDRFFDVGLAEQCAVTFAAGIATENLKPVVAIYSTFLQRSYDQILHDVCLQNLPVIFALDRGGLVGADGPTHHGVFDFSYLRHMPNMTLMAPRDEAQLQQMIKTAVDHEDGPIAFRYPRGAGVGVPLPSELTSIAIGKGEILREGDDLLIIAIGNRVHPALEATRILENSGISTMLIDARFVKPLDEKLILSATERIGKVLTIEDNVLAGGFGSAILELFANHDFMGIKIKNLGISDRFVEHGDLKTLYQECGCDTSAIVSAGVKLVR